MSRAPIFWYPTIHRQIVQASFPKNPNKPWGPLHRVRGMQMQVADYSRDAQHVCSLAVVLRGRKDHIGRKHWTLLQYEQSCISDV